MSTLLRVSLLAGLLLAGSGGLAGVAQAANRAAPTDPSVAGRAIFQRGILPSGAALEGSRQAGGLGLSGAAAACVNCHRRSGLGSTEGVVTIPPITGTYLFHSRTANANEPALHFVENMHGSREPYTDETLARAIREGLDSEGKPLGALMPRFALSDADVAELIAYLKSLGTRRPPGITDTVLHFATIITPDADPAKRQGMLDVLQEFFKDKNAFPFGPSPQMRTSSKTVYAKSMYIANRHWQLHVWELKGAPDTWRRQLDEDFAREPVMAAIAGLGGSQWKPVHDFCEASEVPCLFANVEVPDDEPGDFYSIYYSRGVLLEAGLVARQLAQTLKDRHGATLRQIYRTGDSGEAGARALAAALQGSGVDVSSQALGAGKPGAGVAAALRGAAKADALMLWLRPADLEALNDVTPGSAAVYLSGVMGGLEHAPVPATWRPRTHMAYPVDLPDKRVVRVDYPLGWFRFRHIPVVAEQVQADTYMACGILAETLNHMADMIDPDYLVERIQEMLDHRYLTGYYPRLTLAPGQTLASKGGYLVRFTEPAGTQVVADGEWMVP
jgi:mono/diheme cytochrome c family protein